MPIKPFQAFQSHRNPLYEGMSFGEREKLKRDKHRAERELLKTLTRDKRALDREKPPKEDPVPPSVRLGDAQSYGCVCGKKFYATAVLPKCPWCGVEGQIRILGRADKCRHDNSSR